MYNTAREDMRLFQQRNIGSPEENPSFYYERSPMNFVDRITCPLLILQGERDPRVRMEEAEQMRERLEAGGKQYELVVYRHEGHGFSRMENRLDFIGRIADWFDRYLH
jgi:dipeptidyl aminopeptidase/acylaminoacyl peptidase